jgi:putative hydrolase of the HAD superfamily
MRLDLANSVTADVGRRHIDTVALDADDTLWHNEVHFQASEARLAELVAPYADRETLGRHLLAIEHRNLKLYGYGIKGFTLSMIEAAIELSDGAIAALAIAEIIEIGRAMLAYEIEPLPGVRETLERLRGRYRVIVITKGDLLDQEAKIARSGLGDLIDDVHIVSEKTADVYTRIFGGPEAASRAVMLGNSLKSDVLPALEAGAFGIHVPYHVTWGLEHAEEPLASPRFHRITRLDEVLGWLNG